MNIRTMILAIGLMASVMGAKGQEAYYQYNHDGFWTYAHYPDRELFATRDANDNITYQRVHYFADDVPVPTPAPVEAAHGGKVNKGFNHDGRAYEQFAAPAATVAPKASHIEIIDGVEVTVLPR